jgi:hypothetical protein
MARKSKSKKLDLIRGGRGVERAEALSRGGQQAVIYRSGGVKASRTKDRRKEASKRACRGRVSP